MIRTGLTHGLLRLGAFNNGSPDRYLPISTDAMRRAAELWAITRNANLPSAAPHSLDGDAVPAVQALTIGFDQTEFIVATENIRHISRLVSFNEWRHIKP